MAARRPKRPAGKSAPGLFDQPPASGKPRSTQGSGGAAAEDGKAGSLGQAKQPADAAGEQGLEPPGPRTLSVGQLTREVASRLGGLGMVRVEGELSGIKRAGSGHVYFSLKDRDAALSCAIWRSRAARAIRFELEEGLQVIAEGKLDVYAPRGSYSLIVERMEPKGIGALLAQLERLKLELKTKGWFERARALPKMPKRIGLVTSRDTAALRDILRTRSLRWPGYPLRLCHSPVQGAGAARKIAGAIRQLDQSGVDVIVLARGGGSLEDLWCFNELPVAEAIWSATVPVVSGVGHETDVTLADLVADHRAHTPTDAAQCVLPDRRQLMGELERLGAFLMEAADGAIEERAVRLRELARRPALADAGRLLGERSRNLEALLHRSRSALVGRSGNFGARLAGLRADLERHSPRARIARWENRLGRTGARLGLLGPHAVERAEQKLAQKAAALEAFSPLRVLARGYSVTTRADDGVLVTDAVTLETGDRLLTRLARGRVLSEVLFQDSSANPPESSSPSTSRADRDPAS